VGNIYYVYNAAVPSRSEKYNWKSVLDGSDPATEWKGYHSLNEIPHLLNPESGFLQNCNGTPFLSTSDGNPDPSDFPSYMVTEGDNPRHRQARQILLNREKFSFEDWTREAYSTHLLNAEKDISALVAAWDELKQTDPSRAKDTEEAIDLLNQWDGVSTVESEAMSLYITWAPMKGQTNSRQLEALEDAIRRLERDWGTWRVPWGEINRLQRNHTGGDESFSDQKDSLPVPGAPGWTGPMFTFYTRKVKGQKRRYGISGNTYVCVVEFGPKVKARSLHTFGASADPSSPHYFDQALRYTKGEFKTAWLTLEEVQKNAEKAYRPGR
jgi:acyl-homoserine-lactone acylase